MSKLAPKRANFLSGDVLGLLFQCAALLPYLFTCLRAVTKQKEYFAIPYARCFPCGCSEPRAWCDSIEEFLLHLCWEIGLRSAQVGDEEDIRSVGRLVIWSSTGIAAELDGEIHIE